MCKTHKKYIDIQSNSLEAIEIVENRNLTRPNVTMKHIWMCLFILILSYFFIAILAILLPIETIYRLIVFVLLFLIFNEFYLRFFGIMLIKCYQHYGTDSMRGTCHCIPSCSEYSILALKKYELIFAFIKIYKRLNKTCDGSYNVDYP